MRNGEVYNERADVNALFTLQISLHTFSPEKRGKPLKKKRRKENYQSSCEVVLFRVFIRRNF